MIEYPLNYPSNTPGIYMLKNTKTGRVYIGETSVLASRMVEWRGAARGTVPCKSEVMRKEFSESDVDDWVFIVLREIPNHTAKERKELELQIIKGIQAKYPGRLLNIYSGPRERNGAGGNARLSEVTIEGNPVTYREAAEYLKCTSETLKKRLARYRAIGEYSVAVEKLAEIKRGRPSY